MTVEKLQTPETSLAKYADCGGSLRQAFPTTTAYVSCRRCGHVFPSPTEGHTP